MRLDGDANYFLLDLGLPRRRFLHNKPPGDSDSATIPRLHQSDRLHILRRLSEQRSRPDDGYGSRPVREHTLSNFRCSCLLLLAWSQLKLAYIRSLVTVGFTSHKRIGTGYRSCFGSVLVGELVNYRIPGLLGVNEGCRRGRLE